MATKRQSPAAVAKARVGGYRGAVDLSGMDPEMKKMMVEGDQANPYAPKMPEMPGWMKQIGSAVQGMFGKKSPGRPAATHPAPANPPTTPAQADSIYQRYVK